MIDNPLIKIYVNKMENRITFKIKTWYYHKLLTSETMKLLISKDKKCEKVPNLEVDEIVLVPWNIVNNGYQQDSRIYQVLAYTIHEKYKKAYKNNKFKISTATWNKRFELPDRSYFVSDIQVYFEHIFKNMEKRLIILQ